MKLLSTVILSSVLAFSSMAMAANDNPTVSKKSVRYSCQQGKKVKVTYGFNKQGLPTFASAVVAGKKRTMPINLDHSDMSGTTFGNEGEYMLGADGMDSKNYRKAAIMITAPDSQIIFKGCTAR